MIALLVISVNRVRSRGPHMGVLSGDLIRDPMLPPPSPFRLLRTHEHDHVVICVDLFVVH
jgi:hypothetical protein